MILAVLIGAHFVGLIVLIWRDPSHLLESHRKARESRPANASDTRLDRERNQS